METYLWTNCPENFVLGETVGKNCRRRTALANKIVVNNLSGKGLFSGQYFLSGKIVLGDLLFGNLSLKKLSEEQCPRGNNSLVWDQNATRPAGKAEGE